MSPLRQITNAKWWGEEEAKRIEQRMQQSSAHSVRDKVLRCVTKGGGIALPSQARRPPLCSRDSDRAHLRREHILHAIIMEDKSSRKAYNTSRRFIVVVLACKLPDIIGSM
ncbi:hypothetical protein K0M31_005795 [Melipona bicolor]|uniref:Uncharacterized protein n=1 Tax=Melipona bicolor TaxID=60889 RepID=A0AA40KM24_9HYME|nr:hypothetical protein K0M31_005795 [Melipona bicolor]